MEIDLKDFVFPTKDPVRVTLSRHYNGVDIPLLLCNVHPDSSYHWSPPTEMARLVGERFVIHIEQLKP